VNAAPLTPLFGSPGLIFFIAGCLLLRDFFVWWVRLLAFGVLRVLTFAFNSAGYFSWLVSTVRDFFFGGFIFHV
jgi:hypothetical protein